MCEDYPCCGHTATDPCEAQWYDAPDAFDQTKNPHCFCDHENGECEVWEEDQDEDCDCGECFICEYGEDWEDEE